MKKVFAKNFRRETMEIMKTMGMTNSDIASNLGVTITTISRWKNGVVSPRPKQFERLKQLASGTLKSEGTVTFTSPHPMGFDQRLIELLLLMPGKMEQLTNQIALLQGEIGSIKERLTALEGDKKKSNHPKPTAKV